MCLSLSVVRHVCVSDRHTVVCAISESLLHQPRPAWASPLPRGRSWAGQLVRLPGHLQAGPGPQRPVGRVGTSLLFPLWVGMFFPESVRLCPHCRAPSTLLGSVHTIRLHPYHPARPHHPAPSTPWAPSTQPGSTDTAELCPHCRAPFTPPSSIDTAGLCPHCPSLHCSHKMPHCPPVSSFESLVSAALSTLTSVCLCSSLTVCKRSLSVNNTELGVLFCHRARFRAGSQTEAMMYVVMTLLGECFLALLTYFKLQPSCKYLL